MSRKKPDPILVGAKIQPLTDPDIVEYIKNHINKLPRDMKSKYIRAALRIIRDHPDLLDKYLENPPAPPQVSLDELLTGS